MTNFWSIIPLLLATTTTWANESDWQDLGLASNQSSANDSQARASATSLETSVLQSYRRLALNEENLRATLQQAAGQPVNAQARATTLNISLPLPDGSFTTVSAYPTEVLSTEIAAQHPEIQTWNVVGQDDKILNGVIDFTALGFHAMLDTPDGDTIFIDPTENDGQREYASFSKRSNTEAFWRTWECNTHDSSSPTLSSTAARTAAAKAGETLHTYDIAIAATAEYTAAKGGQTNALSAITTTVSRVNQIYQRDLSIKLTLVSGTNTIFTNTTTDGYTHGNTSKLIDENITKLGSISTLASFDVGHVFDTAGGGMAYVGVTCSSYRAGGATGVSNTGDTFDIDYFAHELGHQFGGSHSFNSKTGSCSGSRSSTTAFEPGSGSTIMGYAGICGTDDLQTYSDAMFHTGSIAEITAFAHDGNGASCATTSSLSNTNPVVSAGLDYTIPARTPFTLNGSATDANGNTLTYSWEQMDTGTASSVDVDTGDNALIRAHLPTTSASRTIPQMSDLVSSVHTLGETLPSTTRTLNFRLTARDGDEQTGRGTAYDDMVVKVYNTGEAFAITSPTSKTLIPSASQTVIWNVAATNQAPINCTAVDIAISTDNGSSFQDLAVDQPNTGAATVTLPSKLGASNYLRVACSDNIFFALSATNPTTASTSSSSTTLTTSTSTSGGGGSIPLTWLLPAGVYFLLRRRKGVRI